MFATMRRGCAQAVCKGFCSSSGEERLAKLLEETCVEFRTSFKEIAKAQLELKGDLRDFKG